MRTEYLKIINRNNIIKAGIVLLFFLGITRLKRFLLPLWNNVFWHGVEWKEKFPQFAPEGDLLSLQWADRLTWSVLVLAFWAILLFFLARINRARSVNHYILNLYSSIGWGILLNMMVNALGLYVNRYLTIILLILPLIIHIVYKVIFPNDRSWQSEKKSSEVKWWSGWTKYIYLSVIILFIFQLANTFLWSTLMRGAPAGDELYVWWTPAKFLHKSGLSSYLLNFDRSNFDPGYSFVSLFYLFFVPVDYFSFASHAVPFIQGSMLILILSTIYRRLNFKQLSVYIIIFQLFLFSNLWIFGMLFFLWYGEPMAICLLTLMFISLDITTHEKNLSDNKSAWGIFFQLFGIGVLVSLSKPPVTKLILLAIIPSFFIFGLFVYKKYRAFFLKKLVYFSLGAIAAKLIWPLNLHLAHKSQFYSIDFSKMFQSYNLTTVWEVTKFFISDYIHCWVPLVILVPLSLLWDKKNIVGVIITLGLMSSILILYLTLWQNIEVMSASRYMTHCAYGWMFYFLAKHRLEITENILEVIRYPLQRRK